MGLFDRFRKKEKDESIALKNMIEEEKASVLPKFYNIRDGWVNAEYYHGQTLESYDTTRLTIDVNNPCIVADHLLYNCNVAWDGKSDTMFLGNGEPDVIQVFGKRRDYKGVWIELDLDKLQTDPNYCNVLMNQLLLKSRVCQYIDNGLKENTERPCGKYIGGVIERDGVYVKNFNPTVGKAAHNSDLMCKRRADIRKAEQERNNRTIAYNNDKIRELQRANQDLQKQNNYEIGE